jgi:hypothetical protein
MTDPDWPMFWALLILYSPLLSIAATVAVASACQSIWKRIRR